MPEEILALDEVERIAKEYVRHRENVADVEVETTEPCEKGGFLLHMVRGKARRQTVDPMTWRAGVVEELPFTLWISNESGKVTHYRRELPPPLPPSSGQLYPGSGYPPPAGPFSPLDFLDRWADRDLKEAREAKEKAKADYYEERAKDIRDRRHKRSC